MLQSHLPTSSQLMLHYNNNNLNKLGGKRARMGNGLQHDADRQRSGSPGSGHFEADSARGSGEKLGNGETTSNIPLYKHIQ